MGKWTKQKEREYRKGRARYGQEQTIVSTYNPAFKPKPGVLVVAVSDEETAITIKHGICPCATCGHRSSGECEELDCICCRGPCT